MTLKEIACKNLLRRKGKAAFVLAGLLIGVATVVAVISFVDAMTQDINHKLEKFGANILIIPRTDNLALTYGGLSLGGVSFEMKEIRQTDLDKVQTIKNAANVAALGPMVLGGVHIGEKRVLMAGVDFQQARILKPWWKVDGRIPQHNQLIMGSEAARVLGLAVGDAVTIQQQRLTVSGILAATGSQDDQLVFTPLNTAQNLLGKHGTVSMAEVAALCKDCPIEEMVKQIGTAIPDAKVMAIQQVVKGRMETLAQFRKFSFGISVVIVLIGGLVVLVTMMGSVRERTEEIGIFRAIGFRKKHVMGIVFMEAGIISGMAGILGYTVGIGCTYLGLRLFFDTHVTAVPIYPELALGAMVMALLVGLVASSYPAFMAAALDPNESLRSL